MGVQLAIYLASMDEKEVVRLIGQYLREHGFTATAEALQAERLASPTSSSVPIIPALVLSVAEPSTQPLWLRRQENFRLYWVTNSDSDCCTINNLLCPQMSMPGWKRTESGQPTTWRS